jgi:hypothetical protein
VRTACTVAMPRRLDPRGTGSRPYLACRVNGTVPALGQRIPNPSRLNGDRMLSRGPESGSSPLGRRRSGSRLGITDRRPSPSAIHIRFLRTSCRPIGTTWRSAHTPAVRTHASGQPGAFPGAGGTVHVQAASAIRGEGADDELIVGLRHGMQTPSPEQSHMRPII